MNRRVNTFLIISIVMLLPCLSIAAGPIQRFALVAGANYGGSDRPMLQYAISDAERFANVLVQLGGVNPVNVIVLKQPKLMELEKAIEILRNRVSEASHDGGGRTELVMYYSGHADDKGLLLGEDRYSYVSLRKRLDDIPADVSIAVLDACASGAFTQIKGGRISKPFLVDESSEMRGHAFLTSSSETEAAQESDRIKASYFTHYLISGLRGGADVSGDGKVTLNEAYQFAFTETLGRTVDTIAGAQHPSYDIQLSGTGDVVITDVRETTSTLVLGESLFGRFFVRNSKKELVVELYKSQGRKIELGLEPGSYEVRIEREGATLLAKSVLLSEGGRVVLDLNQFTPTATEVTIARGGVNSLPFAVSGRNRIELRLGMWHPLDDSNSVFAPLTSNDLIVGVQYMRYFRESLALTVGFEWLSANEETILSNRKLDENQKALSLPLGIRWNPLERSSERAIKPYSASVCCHLL